jgi:hypothetical protein
LGAADAVVMPFGSPVTASPPIRRLAQTIDLVVVPIPTDKAAGILEEPQLKGYRTVKIRKDAIHGVDSDLDAVAVGTFAATRADVPDDLIYEFTKAFFENIEQFYPVHASAKEYTVAGSLEEPTIPFHPGAIRYYKEIGAWTPELEKKQMELLENQ